MVLLLFRISIVILFLVIFLILHHDLLGCWGAMILVLKKLTPNSSSYACCAATIHLYLNPLIIHSVTETVWVLLWWFIWTPAHYPIYPHLSSHSSPIASLRQSRQPNQQLSSWYLLLVSQLTVTSTTDATISLNFPDLHYYSPLCFRSLPYSY